MGPGCLSLLTLSKVLKSLLKPLQGRWRRRWCRRRRRRWRSWRWWAQWFDGGGFGRGSFWHSTPVAYIQNSEKNPLPGVGLGSDLKVCQFVAVCELKKNWERNFRLFGFFAETETKHSKRDFFRESHFPARLSFEYKYSCGPTYETHQSIDRCFTRTSKSW